ncbi:MAG: hypothetical protein WDO19_21000 [Bacteroidota bacterium]
MVTAVGEVSDALVKVDKLKEQQSIADRKGAAIAAGYQQCRPVI